MTICCKIRRINAGVLIAEPTGLSRLLDGSLSPAANGLGHEPPLLQSPPAEAQRSSRNHKPARSSFFSEEVGQPVLNIPSLKLGEAAAHPAMANQLTPLTTARNRNIADCQYHVPSTRT